MFRARNCRMPLLAAMAALLLLWTGGAAAEARPDRVRIVTTTTDLASIARYIAGDLAEVRAICAGDDDPHYLEAVPSYISIARRADLWVRVGMDLEIGWEGPVIDGSRNRAIRPNRPGHLDASQGVLRLDVPTERVTPAMGDVHPAGNPHYWTDPLNGRIVADTIADRLEQLRPAHAETFRENLQRFQRELDARMFGEELVEAVGGERLWALKLEGRLEDHLRENEMLDGLGGWKGRMRPLAGREVVAFHKSWVYFANRFGLSIPIELEPKPGIPPTARHLRDVVDLVEGRGIGVILMAPFYPRRGADFVAQRTGAIVVVCPLSVPGDGTDVPAEGYLDLLDKQVDTIASALGG